MKRVICFKCGASSEYENVLSRSAECEKCGSDLKVCLNCKFYDESAHNQCVEPQAEPVAVKDRGNFCGYFEPSGKGGKGGGDSRDEAKKRLDALFKK
ncbi:MAG: hypothetical protein Kow0090_07350 [Myxococcota bacterium]